MKNIRTISKNETSLYNIGDLTIIFNEIDYDIDNLAIEERKSIS